VIRRSVIVDAVRTPIGRHGGVLAGVRPDDLAAGVLRHLLARTPVLDPAAVDDVYLGASNQAGEDNRNVARMALLLAGLPVGVPGATVNRLCGSGLEAVVAADRAVAVGDAEVCLAGGVESMSRAPWVLPRPEALHGRGDAVLVDTTLGWRLVNPRMPAGWTVSLDEGAERLADAYGVTREAQDAFALGSHRRAAAAWADGHFADEVVAVDGVAPARDEAVRPDASAGALARLAPAFRPDGTVTAGNASPLADGAAAVLLASQEACGRLGRRPLAQVVSAAVSAVSPPLYGIAPVEAAERALKRAGIGWADLAAVELNEAFAAQALACLASWPELDPAVVNPNGGAVALGHPVGCSGARVLATLVWELRRRGGGHGLATLCTGVGQGIAVVVEAEAGDGPRPGTGRGKEGT
jgi:acetyl-CoA acetyltransferase family protein